MRVVPGAVDEVLPAGLALLQPEDHVFAAMLDGWRSQQVARNLSARTIGRRRQVVERFQRSLGSGPWEWTAGNVDDFFMELRGVQGAAHSTLLSYQDSLRMFMAYITDSAYGWLDECEQRFGTHPVQICHDWNTAVHVQDALARPRKRPFTQKEMQDLLDCADELVVSAARTGRKGWVSAFRLATIVKTAYAWGPRRNEVRMLEDIDFSPNPHAPQFGRLGAVRVRYGKAMRGSPPKRRTVLTVPQFSWAVECLDQWLTEVRPGLTPQSSSLWPSERAAVVGADSITKDFGELCRRADMPLGLDFHSLRRSYVTHLIEAGYDDLFVQQQVGHEYASTTAIYTGVSAKYRTKMLQHVMNSLAGQVTNPNDAKDES